MAKRKRLWLSQLRRAIVYFPPYDGPPGFKVALARKDRKIWHSEWHSSEDDLIQEIKDSGYFVIYDDMDDFTPKNGLEFYLVERIRQLEMQSGGEDE